MNPVFEAALEIQLFMKERSWRFAIVGGLAVQRWGEPRATRDVDVALLTGFGPEEEYIEEILTRFRSRITDPADFALNTRVLLLTATNGIGIDVIPVRLQTRAEVAVDKVALPSDIRRGTPFQVRVVLNNYSEPEGDEPPRSVAGRVRIVASMLDVDGPILGCGWLARELLGQPGAGSG